MHWGIASRSGRAAAVLLAGCIPAAVFIVLSVQAQSVDKYVLEAEAKRITVIKKVKPSVVAIFAHEGQGGGSGVLIDANGYALTNFHVVEGSEPVKQCGLPDGVLYDAVVVGLDKVGDVALIKLLPKKQGQKFPFAVLGDSDKVQAGDWSLAMGNPFLLATDFNPTVTFGLVSGVHRYQYPAGTLLEYTDCIQIDTSINPGNSGGPLFNMDGELIGINGRGSFEKRGRVNSGVGYAVSINQIRNFLGHLRAGLDADHATLGATIQTADKDKDEGSSARLVVSDILEDSDVHRRGLDVDDELVSFAGRPMTSVNEFKNVLGLFPKGWRVPLVYRHNNEKHEILVRLMQLQRRQTTDDSGKPKPRPVPPRPRTPPRNTAAGKMYQPKPGFANFYFNKLQRARLMAGFRRHGDFSAVAGDWVASAQAEIKQKKINAKIAVREELADRGPDGKPVAQAGTYHLRAETLPPLPKADARADKTPLRQAVRKAAGLLRQHARSFPQEFWAPATEEQLKEQVIDAQKNVVVIQSALQDALDELRKVEKDRAKEDSLLWRFHYDYTLGKLSAFLAYVYEYNYLLGQLRKEPPKRDPKVHRGWRMVANDKLGSGPEARHLAADAAKIWAKISKNYNGTYMEDIAKRESRILLGLKWQPTGGTKTMVYLDLGSNATYKLDPLLADQDVSALEQPGDSGGLMTALYQYRRLLTLGPAGFEEYAYHGGDEPFYPPPADPSKLGHFKDRRVDTEVLLTAHAAVATKWYFSLKDQTLLGFEVTVEQGKDPCEVYLSDYQPDHGWLLPHRIEVWHGDNQYGVFTNIQYQLAGAK